MPPALPATLRSDVRLQLRDSEKEQAQAEAARTTAAGHDRAAAALYATMGWRERWLWNWLSGLLGGDKRKTANYTEQQKLSATFNARADQHLEFKAGHEATAEKILDDHLRAHDDDYKTLMRPFDAGIEMKKEVGAFLGCINSALREIDEAQSMETMDLVSKNKGISLMSSIETSQAKDAINKVNRAAPHFQKAAARYSEELKGLNLAAVSTDMMNTIDLVFDMALDSFDFMSIFALNALQNSEDGMKKARAKVAEAGDIVEANLEKATQARTAYLDSARKLCL